MQFSFLFIYVASSSSLLSLSLSSSSLSTLFFCLFVSKKYIYNNNNNFEGEEKLTNINNIKRTNEKREIERDREISRKLKFISTTIVILNFVKVFEKEKVKLNWVKDGIRRTPMRQEGLTSLPLPPPPQSVRRQVVYLIRHLCYFTLPAFTTSEKFKYEVY